MNIHKALALASLIALPALFTAAPARSQSRGTHGAGATPPPAAALEVRPLVRSIHFQLDPTAFPGGDTMTGATIEWRTSGGKWKPGLPFQRTCTLASQADPRWGTILPGAVEGATYDYRISATGTPYDSKNPWTGTVTTLSTTEPAYPETVFHITPADNVHDVVMSHLDPDPAKNRGKVFEFAAGTYRQAPFQWNEHAVTCLGVGGDAQGWVIFRPAKGAEGQVIFDGSDPAFDVKDAGKWTLYTDSNITPDMKIYRAAYPSDPGHLYWDAGDGQGKRLLWVSRDQSAAVAYYSSGLVTQPGYASSKGYTKDDSLEIRATQYPNEGSFCWQDGYLYVHLHNGVDPNTVYMKIPSLRDPWAIWSDKADKPVYGIKTKGLTFRYFGLWTGTVFSAPGDNAPIGGLRSGTCERIVYEDVTVEGFGQSAFLNAGGSWSTPPKNIIWKNCHVRLYGTDPSDGTGALWDHIKMSPSESYGWVHVCNGASIIDGECRGSFNGIDSGGGSSGYKNNTGSPFWEVDNVKFMGIADDCIEPDNFCTSYIASRCDMTYSYKGISLAPAGSGPVMILRNTFYNSGYWGTQAYKEAGTKFGNYQGVMPDIGYKLLAHNTFVNAHTDWGTRPGVGFSSSGVAFNLHVLNNYSYSDILPIDFADGGMGYPHEFDHNYYGLAHFGAWQPPDLGAQKDRWGLARVADGGMGQEDSIAGTVRRYTTFLDWQQGHDSNGANMPGYVAGVVPQNPVAGPGGTWLHDPHSFYEQRSDTGLTDPAHGNYYPVAGSSARKLGGAIDTVNINCLPGWSSYEVRAGQATAGAVQVAGNAPPNVNVPSSLAGLVGTPVTVPVTVQAQDNTIATFVASVKGPADQPLDPNVNMNGTSGTINFTPQVPGNYLLVATATDTQGLATSASSVVSIAPPAASTGGGSDTLAVTLTPSPDSSRPGEPVVYTLVCTNPTQRTMKDVTLREAMPAQVTLNTASAMLDGQPASITFVNGVLQLPLGDMAPGAHHTLTVTAIVN